MSTTENERLELYELAKQEVGERFARLMMRALPPEPRELATKGDVALVRSDLRAEMADLRSDLRTEMAEVRTEMAELRTDLRTEMAELRTDLRTEMAELRTDMAVLRTDMTAEIRATVTAQTRTLMLGLVGSVTAMAMTDVLVNAFG